MTSLGLLVFWIALATSFGAMSILSHRMRATIPKKLDEAMKAASFEGADVTKLKPLFDHLFWFEFGAFVLTSAAALVEFLTLAGILV